MRIAISGESPMDFDNALQAKTGVYSVPFHIHLGDVEYLDNGEHPNEELFEYFDRTKQIPRTAAANIGEIRAHFDKILEDHDAIIHFTISSGMSSGYQNACNAADGDPRITVIDSHSFSLGIGYLAYRAKQLADEGKTVEEILKVIETLQNEVSASLVVRDLWYMAKGGRCSSLIGLLGSVLHIIPLLEVIDGKLANEKKFQGNIRKLGKKYVETMIAKYSRDEEIDYSLAMVGYSTELHSGVQAAVDTLKEMGFKEVVVTKCNATCPSHGGPDVIGFSFRHFKKS